MTNEQTHKVVFHALYFCHDKAINFSWPIWSNSTRPQNTVIFMQQFAPLKFNKVSCTKDRVKRPVMYPLVGENHNRLQYQKRLIGKVQR